MKLATVILAGGRGTRFWPISRKERPKQLIPLIKEKTLLELTLLRLKPLEAEETIVITTKELERFISHYVDKSVKIISEPEGRNTLPAITLAAVEAESDYIAVFPSDHLIKNDELFRREVERALKFIERRPEYIVTFGIEPTYPATGYGYIKVADEIWNGVLKASQFKEKPPLELARQYVESKKFLWNGGIFLFSKNTFFSMLREFQPEIYQKVEEKCLLAKYSELPSISIDYGIVEKTSKVATVPLPKEVGWSDLGSWNSLLDFSNEGSNFVKGKGKLFASQRSILWTEDRFVVCVGLEDFAIIVTQDAILALNLKLDQEVRKVVEYLEKNGFQELV